MERQRRCLLMNANRLNRVFSSCSDEVKKQLFQTYCANMYCAHLWSNHNKATLQKIKVAYNNAFRKLFGLNYRCSASNMFFYKWSV